MEKEEEIKLILQQIKDTTDFTCSYWYPVFENTQKHSMEWSRSPDVIWEIIKSRSQYVACLEERLKQLIKSL